MTFRLIAMALGLSTLCWAGIARPSAAQAPVVRPGDQHLSTAHLTDQVWHFQAFVRNAQGDTAEKRRPGTSEEQHVVQGHDILLIKASESNGRSFSDSMLFHRAGLVPVREVMSAQGSRTVFSYSGNRVHIVVTRGDSVIRNVDSTFAVPVFGFNQLETLIQSLPLKPGYHAILPLFSEGSVQLEMDTVTVTGEDRHAPQGAQWVVRFADPAIVVTYGINMKTRAIDRYDVVQRATGDRFRRVAQ